MKLLFPSRIIRAKLWLLLLCLSTLSLPLMAKDKPSDVFKVIKPPTSEWKLRKVNDAELDIGVKGKPKAINIGLKIIEDMPLSAGTFLDQVRSKAVEDPDTRGAEVSLLNQQTRGGLTWDVFVIKRKDEINQEFWARTLPSDRVLLVLYTAVGTYYPQYRNDFLKVLEQAAK